MVHFNNPTNLISWTILVVLKWGHEVQFQYSLEDRIGSKYADYLTANGIYICIAIPLISDFLIKWDWNLNIYSYDSRIPLSLLRKTFKKSKTLQVKNAYLKFATIEDLIVILRWSVVISILRVLETCLITPFSIGYCSRRISPVPGFNITASAVSNSSTRGWGPETSAEANSRSIA